MTYIDIQEHKTRREQAFRVNVHKNVAASGTLSIHLHNPADSERRIVVTLIKVTGRGPYNINRPINFDVTNGSTTPVQNKAVGSNKSTLMNVYQESTYSNEDYLDIEYFGDIDATQGENSNAFGGENTEVFGTILQSEDLFIEVENVDSSANDYSITMEYYETAAT